MRFYTCAELAEIFTDIVQDGYGHATFIMYPPSGEYNDTTAIGLPATDEQEDEELDWQLEDGQDEYEVNLFAYPIIAHDFCD